MNFPAFPVAETPQLETLRMPSPAHPASPSVPAMIAGQAGRQPDRLALATGAEQLTYSEMETRATQLAHHLRSLGAGPEVLVGLCLERSPDFVVAALAIMKCRAAYLPMDPSNPAERLRFIAQDAGMPLLVTNHRLAAHFGGSKIRLVALDAEREAIAQQPTTPLVIDPPGDDPLAYVIYTSGSTGQPKGVEITHANLSNLVAWHRRAFAVDNSTRASFQAGVAFDAAVWEIWSALAAGASLHLPDENTRMSGDALRDWLVSERITISFVPTALAEQLIALRWPAETALRFLLTGADTLHRYPAPGLPFALVNNYGPTECTVVTTSGIVSPAGSQSNLPSIGSPIDQVGVHILDESRHEMVAGETGEIYVSGAGVARGYRNRPDLTARSFLGNSPRMYRTGDRGRRLPNGEIEFLGRNDDQIKMRGYRIELNEINAVLNAHPSVGSSVVVAREDAPGEKRLVAYLVAAAGVLPNEQILRDTLRASLPDYMEPAVFVWLDALPLNANGKIDRAALPAPTADNTSAQSGFTAPRTPTEEALARIICEVLKIERVGVHDDFFQLGGHSLLGAQVIARVRGTFGTELKLLDVFDSPTVAQLSVKIEESITRQLNAMSEAEVSAALAAFEHAAATEKQPA